ncbi:MAG TPA: hypothetical protein PKH40_02145 [Treponemataceae bacterium]|nr:hypothetical protein [Treponemataceae bacterium]
MNRLCALLFLSAMLFTGCYSQQVGYLEIENASVSTVERFNAVVETSGGLMDVRLPDIASGRSKECEVGIAQGGFFSQSYAARVDISYYIGNAYFDIRYDKNASMSSDFTYYNNAAFLSAGSTLHVRIYADGYEVY